MPVQHARHQVGAQRDESARGVAVRNLLYRQPEADQISTLAAVLERHQQVAEPGVSEFFGFEVRELEVFGSGEVSVSQLGCDPSTSIRLEQSVVGGQRQWRIIHQETSLAASTTGSTGHQEHSYYYLTS
jgi:hypothetical protein